MKKLILAAATAGVLALFSGLATPVQAQVTSNDQVLFGITFFKNELIRIDLTTGEGTLVGTIDANESGYGLTTYNGGLYTFNPNTNRIDQLSTVDGRVLSSTDIGVTGLAGEGDLVIASDTGDGFLASAFDADGNPTHPLYAFSLTAGTGALIGNTSVALDGLAVDSGGVLYALGQGDSGESDPATVDTELYSVNKTTGALTPIGPIGVPQNSPIAGLTFSPDGTLYASIDDKLYTINPSTGAATIVDAATPDFSFSSVSGLAMTQGASVLANLSSRANVLTGDDVLITGLIITAETPGVTGTKLVIFRGLGPSLSVAGQLLAGTLSDPTMTLFDSNGAPLATNDDWMQNSAADQTTITNAGLAPGSDKESVLVAQLPEGKYTAVLSGVNEATGIALEEVYDLEEGNGLKAANLSARALVSPGDNALIGGMIVEGSITKHSIVRGLGPSLSDQVPAPLADPELMLFDANGTVIETNNDWMMSPEAADITAQGLAPSDPKEAVIDQLALEPGAYTIVLTGVGTDTTGTALIEAYDVP